MYSEADVLARCMHNTEDALRGVFFPMFKAEFDHIVGVPAQCGYQTPTHCLRGITFEQWKLIRYAEFRAANYPKMEEQLDMHFHDREDGTSTAFEAIKAVKERYPKPEPDSWLWRYLQN